MAKKIAAPAGPAGNPDYVEPGSERHAAIIGLVPAQEGCEFVREDKQARRWTLADTTAWGPQATAAFLGEVLRQKVSTLDTPPVMPQSKNRNKPGYAPPLMRYREPLR